MKQVVTKAESFEINFTSFALAKMSNGLHLCSENYIAKDIPVLNYFLFCASIELGIKSAILSNDISTKNKNKMKSIGHDLDKLFKEYKKVFKNSKTFDANDLKIIKMINPFYKTKGLEYFTSEVIFAHINGLKDFPPLFELNRVSKKVNIVLADNKYFMGF